MNATKFEIFVEIWWAWISTKLSTKSIDFQFVHVKILESLFNSLYLFHFLLNTYN